MEAEMDAVLGYEKNQKGDLASDNKRNGYSTKTLKSQYGEFPIDIPRDRNGEFEPKLIPKYQRDISGIEEKVISLYARGMSTRDIHDQLQDLYGIELSAEMRGERLACLEARRHMAWYLRGVPYSGAYKSDIVKIETLEDMRKIA